MKCCRPPSFWSSLSADHEQGRSWADHGQTMGDRFMQKNPENFSFFRYRFFAEKFWKFAIFLLGVNKAFSYSCRPRTCFFGKKRLYFWSNINFTHWNRLFSQQWLILHVEAGMFCKKTCLIPRGRSCLAVRQWLLSSRDGGLVSWDSEEFDEEKPPGLHASAMRGRHGRRLRSFVVVLERSQEIDEEEVPRDVVQSMAW